MYDVWSVKCEVWYVMCDVWCEKCDMWYVMCDVWCVMWEVWYVMCDMWCVMYEVWSVMYEVWSVKCEVWCVRCEVWSVMCEVWCEKCDMWCVIMINLILIKSNMVRLWCWGYLHWYDITSVGRGYQSHSAAASLHHYLLFTNTTRTDGSALWLCWTGGGRLQQINTIACTLYIAQPTLCCVC